MYTPNNNPVYTIMMHVAAVQIIKQHEGLRLKSYPDSGGRWTIGYGHCGPEVQPGLTWNELQANEALEADMAKAEAAIKSVVKVPLNENQLSALISFTFNVGTFNFARSGILKLLNRGDYKAAMEHLLLWNKIGSYVSPGLTKRRQDEKALFETKDVTLP